MEPYIMRCAPTILSILLRYWVDPSLGARPSHMGGGGSGKLAYINSLWDMASLRASGFVCNN